MSLGKQAKTLTPAQLKAVLAYAGTKRHQLRDVVMVLLSVKAGLRAKEVALVTWSMVTDAEGAIANTIELPNTASKGRHGGRSIPLNKDLKKALLSLMRATDESQPHKTILLSERGSAMRPHSVVSWFRDTYQALGFDGCSSHSGRRTFITRMAQVMPAAGGTLKDVQSMAGHASLNMTSRYIEGSADARAKAVDLI